MSYAFYIDNVTHLCVNTLRKDPHFCHLTFLENTPQPSDDGLWPSEPTYIYIDQHSGRTLEASFEGSTLQLRIFAGSSPADYLFAIKLAHRIAIDYCSTIYADNTAYTPDTFRQTFTAEWAWQHSTEQLKQLLLPAQQHLAHEGKLSGIHREMPIGKNLLDDLNNDTDDIAAAFFKRQKRLNYIDDDHVYIARLMQVQLDELGTTIRLSIYSQGIATLITDNNTIVAFHNGFYNNLDKNDIAFHVQAKTLKTILGDAAMWLSNEHLLLPKLTEHDWLQLIAKAKSYAIKNLSAYKLSAQELSQQRFLTATEIDALASAPVQILKIMMGQLTSVQHTKHPADNKKLAAPLKTYLLANCVQNNAFTQRIVLKSLADFDRFWDDKPAAKETHNVNLSAIANLLATKVPADDAVHFRHFLLKLAHELTNTSSGFLGLFNHRIAKQERHTLVWLEQTLDFTTTAKAL